MIERKDGMYPVAAVIDYIPNRNGNRKTKVWFNGDYINMTSLRLITFKIKGVKCSTCGVIGTKFYKERSTPDTSYHFNLYAYTLDGNEILMTKDHIIPVCQGGENHLNNMQTMCEPCNKFKGGMKMKRRTL